MLGSALCCVLSACSGDIGDGPRSQITPPVGGAGTGGPGAAPGAGPATPDVQAADAAMRASDPALFEIALRYFPGQTAAGSAPRLFRLTPAQLDATAQALLPAADRASLLAVMPRDPLQTNYEYAENLSWNAANFTPYTGWVGALAASAGEDPRRIVDCSAEADAESCLRAQARRFVTRAFRGVASEAQLARFADFFVASAGEVGVPAATVDLVDVTLTSPGFVFRDEVQTGADRRLLPAQLLQALTYTLADLPPEALGLAPEQAATLVGDAAALHATAERVLARPEARAKLMRFFLAWLEVKEIDEFTIAESVFPEFTPELAAAIVADTRAFLEQQLQAATPSLKDITQAARTFSGPLASLYRDGADQRLGIFTEPAVIASHSGPTTTRLVKRGVFFTRKVMCLPLGAPPEGVDTTLPPDTPATTERQRVESVTAQLPCSGCHMYINPFGFMQEAYDAIGRFRTSDEGQPVDPSIMIDFLEEGPFSARTGIEALRGLTATARFKQCFTRQLYRFYMGRDEVGGDDPVLRQMFFAFAEEDAQDILAMLRVLAGSVSLTQRTETP